VHVVEDGRALGDGAGGSVRLVKPSSDKHIFTVKELTHHPEKKP
jgi:hypothetical protein